MNAILDEYRFDSRSDGLDDGRAACPREVRRAIEALARADLHRLERFAAWRTRGLPDSESWRTHEDLLSEAIELALEGRRRWDPARVDFVGYLTGAMRSISSNWARAARGAPAEADAEAVESAPSPSDAPDARILRAERERAALAALAGDPVASRILEDLLDGRTHDEIRSLRRLDDLPYKAALRRIRRRVAGGRA